MVLIQQKDQRGLEHLKYHWRFIFSSCDISS